MSSTKLLASILLILAVLFVQVGNAAAAPQTQGTALITGTIQSIVIETNTNGAATVVVTVLDSQGGTQTVPLSVDTAVALGLAALDPATNAPVVDETQVGKTIEIDPASVLPAEEAVHPIADLLADFFDEAPGVIDGYHEDGFGFGVIAQALWMSESINGDASAAGLILEAKKSGDYSAFELPDGSSPTNWGQFKKAVLQKDKKNLGIIVSGRAENKDASDQQDHGNGKDKDKDKGKDKGKDKNKNKP